THIGIELGPLLSSGGSGESDNVTVDGSSAADAIQITANDHSVAISGLAAQVTLNDAEAADVLLVQGQLGNDTIDASLMPASSVSLVLSGGDGDDLIKGGVGVDVLLGGDGIDTLLGGAGNDTLNGGGGNDVFDGGNGDDTILAGDGDDFAN